MTYMPCPSTRTFSLGVMKFTILVDPSSVIITTYLVFKRNTAISYFFLQNYLPVGWGGGGHEIYYFLSPYPPDATYQIWLKLAQ